MIFNESPNFDDEKSQIDFLINTLAQTYREPRTIQEKIQENTEYKLYKFYDNTTYYSLQYQIAQYLNIGITVRKIKQWSLNYRENLTKNLPKRYEIFLNDSADTDCEFTLQKNKSNQNGLIVYDSRTRIDSRTRNNTIKDLIFLYELTKLDIFLEIIQEATNNLCPTTRELAINFLQKHNTKKATIFTHILLFIKKILTATAKSFHTFCQIFS